MQNPDQSRGSSRAFPILAALAVAAIAAPVIWFATSSDQDGSPSGAPDGDLEPAADKAKVGGGGGVGAREVDAANSELEALRDIEVPKSAESAGSPDAAVPTTQKMESPNPWPRGKEPWVKTESGLLEHPARFKNTDEERAFWANEVAEQQRMRRAFDQSLADARARLAVAGSADSEALAAVEQRLEGEAATVDERIKEAQAKLNEL